MVLVLDLVLYVLWIRFGSGSGSGSGFSLGLVSDLGLQWNLYSADTLGATEKCPDYRGVLISRVAPMAFRQSTGIKGKHAFGASDKSCKQLLKDIARVLKSLQLTEPLERWE